MKKLTFLIGAATGFVIGSRMGRGPYEQLEGAVRQVTNHPAVHDTLQSAADSAESARDAALDATSGAMDEVARAASKKSDELAGRSKVSNSA